MNSDLENKINSIKEAMANMPKNNVKNKEKYKEYIDSLIEEANILNEKVNKEIKDRYQRIIDTSNNGPNIEVDPRIDKYKEYLELSNTYNTSYEKSGLDRIIDELIHYYQDDFSKVNEDIKKCLNIFKTVGINLTKDNFNYSIYVNKYMTLFIEEYKKDNLETENLKKCFEEVYWKCPDLITEIAFNISYLYYKNKKAFDKYYNEAKNKVIKELNINEKDVITNYKKVLLDNYLDEKYNIKNILNKFLDKTYKIEDYEEAKIDNYYNSIGDNNRNIDALNNLLTTLKEYKYYKEYAYIIEDVSNIYKEKTKYKDIFKNKLKEVTKNNNKIIGLTKKYLSKEKSKFFNNKDKLEKLLLDNETEIINIKASYDELELDKFNELIFTLTDSYTIYDLLKIASSYYIYIKELIKKTNEGISNEEIEKKINELKEFVDGFDINIINYISINEERNIALIISDKYKLLGINIPSDNIENSLDPTIETIEKIILKNKMDKSALNYEDIEFVCNSNEIINK